MYRFFDMGLEAGVAAVILVPLFLVVNRIYFHDLGRTVGYLIFAIYLACVDAVVGLPCITYIRLDFNYNFAPFLYMFSDYRSSLLNVLLFVPFGIFLPILWSSFRSLRRTVLTGLAVSGVIELAQLFTFRTTDINDLITNTLGAALGFCIAKGFTQNFTTHTAAAEGRDFYTICGLVAGVMFFLQPYVSMLLWSIIL